MNNNYAISIDKNNLNLIHDQIKLNIAKESETILNHYIIPQKNELIKEYYSKTLEEKSKNNYDLNEIYKIIKNIIPKVNGNFSAEIEQDLNILYKDLFNYIGKLMNLNHQEKDFNIENETNIYYKRILDYLNISNVENNYTNEYLNNTDEELIKDITIMIFKRINEKNITTYKSYINKVYGKYENFKNEKNFNSIVSELYENYQKKNLMNSYNDVYKNITSNIFNLTDFDIKKTSIDEIKQIVLKSYEKNFNEFIEKYKYENNGNKINNEKLIKLIEEKIEKILSKIKNTIETSSKEALNINNDNYYLKKHIINIFESQYKYKNSINEQFSEYFDRNYIKMEYVEETMKKLYSSKLQEILTNNFEYYLKDYYSKYYIYEIKQKIILPDKYYYSLITSFSGKFTNNQLDYIKLLLSNNYDFTYYTKQKIMNIIKKF